MDTQLDEAEAHTHKALEIAEIMLRAVADELEDPMPMDTAVGLAIALGRTIAFGVKEEHWDLQLVSLSRIAKASAEEAAPRVAEIMSQAGVGDN